MLRFIARRALQAVVTILVTALFIVLWRMWCEIVLVMFKILERLGEVRDRLKP